MHGRLLRLIPMSILVLTSMMTGVPFIGAGCGDDGARVTGIAGMGGRGAIGTAGVGGGAAGAAGAAGGSAGGAGLAGAGGGGLDITGTGGAGSLTAQELHDRLLNAPTTAGIEPTRTQSTNPACQ